MLRIFFMTGIYLDNCNDFSQSSFSFGKYCSNQPAARCGIRNIIIKKNRLLYHDILQ